MFAFVHPNDFAAYIILVLPLTIGVFLKKQRLLMRLLWGAIISLGFWCLLRTSSRGAWLGFVCGAAVFLFYYKRKLFWIVPVLVILFAALSPDGFNRFSKVFNTQEGTGWERVQLWKGTWSMIKEHPWLGFGINTYSQVFPNFKPVEYPDLKYAHNCYLQMWSEIGIAGLTAFLFFVGSVIFPILKGLGKKIRVDGYGLVLLGAMAGYISFLVHSAFDTNLYSLVLYTHFWIFSAFLISACNLLTEK